MKINGTKPDDKGGRSTTDQDLSASPKTGADEQSSKNAESRGSILRSIPQEKRLAGLLLLCIESLLVAVFSYSDEHGHTLSILVFALLFTLLMVFVFSHSKKTEGYTHPVIIACLVLFIFTSGALGYLYLNEEKLLAAQGEDHKNDTNEISRLEAAQTVTERRLGEANIAKDAARVDETKSENEAFEKAGELERDKAELNEVRGQLAHKVVELQDSFSNNAFLRRESDALEKKFMNMLPPETGALITDLKIQLDVGVKNSVEQQKKCSDLESYSAPLKAVGLRNVFPIGNDFLGKFEDYALLAKNEIDFLGVNFHITVNNRHDQLLDLLRKGKTLRFLILDPNLPSFDQLAADFGQTPEALKQECKLGETALQNLKADWTRIESSMPNPGRLEVQVCSWVPRYRVYIFDEFAGGSTYVIPYINGVDSGSSPGFLYQNIEGGCSDCYIRGFKAAWKNSQSLEKVFASQSPALDHKPTGVPTDNTPKQPEEKQKSETALAGGGT